MSAEPERRLRIAYIYRSFDRSGSIPSFFLDRTERLAYDEDVVAVCSAKGRASSAAPLRFLDVEPLLRGTGRFTYAIECASFAVRASRALSRHRDEFDVVHVVGFAAPDADIVTVNAVRRAELAHYFDHVEPRSRVRRKLAPVLRPQNLVVERVEDRLFRPPYPLCLTETRAIADDLERLYGVPPEAIEVIPSGIDVERFRPDPERGRAVRTAHHIDDAQLLILFVGNEFRRKGLERAIAALAQTGSGPKLWVVGGGDRRPYEEQARSLGVADRIAFFGVVPNADLPPLYTAADVILLPSRQDAWGQPVLEAMACGAVPVTSEYTGIREILEDGKNGFLLSGSGEPEEIAAVIDRLAEDAELRARAGARAAEAAAPFDRRALYRRLREAHHLAYARRSSRA